MKLSVLACLVLALSGCSTQSTVVRCNTRLERINTPAPKALAQGSVNTMPEQKLIEGEDRRE